MPQELTSFSSNADIVCPFFKEQHRCIIKCEGVFKGMHNTILSFKTVEDKNDQINSFCIDTRCFHGCPIAIAVMERLEDEEGGEQDGKAQV